MARWINNLIDRWLSAAASAPRPFRVALARKAARRGLAAVALNTAPDDPVVLTELGLHRSAADSPDPFTRMIGLAGMGRVDEARRLHEAQTDLTRSQRIRLARAAAPYDALFALGLLPSDQVEARTACLLALSRIEEAERLLPYPSTAEQFALAASALNLRGRLASERGQLNALFVRNGLEPPFAVTDAAPSIFEAKTSAPFLQGDHPLVSIVIAARNADGTIGNALESLTRQTWRDLQIIVVDDNSTDNTAAIVQTWRERDVRIILIPNALERGAYGARNTGVATARGSIIVFHDADDWAHPRRIERQVERMGGGAASVCRYLRLTDDGGVVNPRIFPLVRYNPIFMAVRREVLSRIGPFDPVQTGGDSELLARLEAQVGRWNVARNPECLVLARWRSGSLMASEETGLSGKGIQARIDYVEAWRRRHANAFRGARRLSTPLENR